jgi:hypothetical protein
VRPYQIKNTWINLETLTTATIEVELHYHVMIRLTFQFQEKPVFLVFDHTGNTSEAQYELTKLLEALKP